MLLLQVHIIIQQLSYLHVHSLVPDQHHPLTLEPGHGHLLTLDPGHPLTLVCWQELLYL